jgi:uncharacterized protein (DUF1501 family)
MTNVNRSSLRLTRRELLILAASGSISAAVATRPASHDRPSTDVATSTNPSLSPSSIVNPPVDPSSTVQRATSVPKQPDRVLVLVNLLGGNDGLNTFVPQRDASYAALRGALAISPDSLLGVDDDIGLHPSLVNLHSRWSDGHTALIHGVGHPAASLSHFYMGDLLQSASDGTDAMSSGWLGRFLDQLDSANEIPAVSLTGSLPLALRGTKRSGEALPMALTQMASDRGSLLSQRSIANLLDRYTISSGSDSGDSHLLTLLSNSSKDALAMASSFGAAVPQFNPQLIGDSAKAAANIINADLGVRVIYLHQDGYDTHAHQAVRHAQLLGALDSALELFWSTMTPDARARTVVAVVSEFGRRVEANGSGGTDHGHANDWLVMGDAVRGGRYGERLPLDRLDPDGNLTMTVDQRAVAATLLGNWMQAEASAIVGTDLAPLTFMS